MTASRRQFLGAAAAASLLPGAAHSTRREARHTDFDVIVIGGGFSGLVAARDCTKDGLRTLLLEARPRLGGRTHTTQWNGHAVELGGTWIHWMQPGVWSEIHRYGLRIAETPGFIPERLVIRGDGFEFDGPAAKAADELASGGERYFETARTIWQRPWDSHFARHTLQASDSITALERLRQVPLTPLQRNAVQSIAEACVHAPIEQGSFLELARCYALGGWQWSLFNDVLSRYQIVEGTSELVRRIAEDGEFDVKLSAPVTRIEQTAELAAVVAGGARYTARAVILAVPMNCLGGIECIPALSAGKLSASRERHTGQGFKFFAEVQGRLGNVMLMAPVGVGLGYAFTYAQLPSSTLIVGFSSNPRAFDANDVQAVQQALRKFLPDAQVLACMSYPWATDAYSRGTYCLYRPGRVLQWQDALAQREGRIFMAGSDVTEGSRGFIDGAITRGAQIAHQVASELS
jgi:monoamine oxidase